MILAVIIRICCFSVFGRVGLLFVISRWEYDSVVYRDLNDFISNCTSPRFNVSLPSIVYYMFRWFQLLSYACTGR